MDNSKQNKESAQNAELPKENEIISFIEEIEESLKDVKPTAKSTQICYYVFLLYYRVGRSKKTTNPLNVRIDPFYDDPFIAREKAISCAAKWESYFKQLEKWNLYVDSPAKIKSKGNRFYNGWEIMVVFINKGICKSTLLVDIRGSRLRQVSFNALESELQQLESLGFTSDQVVCVKDSGGKTYRIIDSISTPNRLNEPKMDEKLSITTN